MRKQTLEESIEEIVSETGQAGPFLFGTAACSLCGHPDHVVITLTPKDIPFEVKLPCDRCGQKQMHFLNLNGEIEDDPNGESNAQ